MTHIMRQLIDEMQAEVAGQVVRGLSGYKVIEQVWSGDVSVIVREYPMGDGSHVYNVHMVTDCGRQEVGIECDDFNHAWRLFEAIQNK